MGLSLKIQRVDCDAKSENELREVLRGLCPRLKSLKVNGKTVDDVHKIVLYRKDEKLKAHVKLDSELKEEIKKDVKMHLDGQKNPCFGLSAHVFLCVADNDFLDESVIAEEIVHSLSEINTINGKTLDKEVFDNYKGGPDDISSRAKLWDTASYAVIHHYTIKTLLLQVDGKIKERLRDRLTKCISEITREIKNKSFNSFTYAYYLPEIALAEELGMIPSLKELDCELYARVRKYYGRILSLLKDFKFEDVPKSGCKLMLAIFEIQLKAWKDEILTNNFQTS